MRPSRRRSIGPLRFLLSCTEMKTRPSITPRPPAGWRRIVYCVAGSSTGGTNSRGPSRRLLPVKAREDPSESHQRRGNRDRTLPGVHATQFRDTHPRRGSRAAPVSLPHHPHGNTPAAQSLIPDCYRHDSPLLREATPVHLWGTFLAVLSIGGTSIPCFPLAFVDRSGPQCVPVRLPFGRRRIRRCSSHPGWRLPPSAQW